MKKIYLFLTLLGFTTAVYSQAVNYTVTVTEVQWFDNFLACAEGGTEEYSALVWFDDDLDGTDVGGTCFECDINDECTLMPNTSLGGRNSTCAETINIIFHAWENDSAPRCTENGGDDCGCGPSSVASINFRNSGTGCTTYGGFGCSVDHNVQVEICWDYVIPPPSNDDCSGATIVTAGATAFTLLEECSGPDITSCVFNDYNDIWYEYTVGSCNLTNLIIDTGGSAYDTGLSIWDACGGNQLACNDDAIGLQSSIIIPGCNLSGTTFFIRISGYNGADGAGVLNITESISANAPSIAMCPSQADIEADMNCMAVVPDFTTAVTGTANCDNSVTITQSPAANSMVGIGAQTVTLTATDDCNNQTASCMISFNVVDAMNPICSPQNTTVNIDATGNAMIAVAQIDGGSTDNCGIVSRTISVGQSAFTCDDVGNAFTVTLQVEDAAGNISTCDATVTVADPAANCCAGPIANCQAFTAQLNTAGDVTISAADVDGGSTAECGIQSIVIDDDSFTCLNTGPNTVTLTITDTNGNSDQCMATVTVEDMLFPTASNPTPIDVQCTADIPVPDVLLVTDEADNCSTTVAFVSESSDGMTCPETIIRLYSVTDPSGNAIEVTQTITINDDMPPVLTIPATATIECDQSLSGAGSTTFFTDNFDTNSGWTINTTGGNGNGEVVFAGGQAELGEASPNASGAATIEICQTFSTVGFSNVMLDLTAFQSNAAFEGTDNLTISYDAGSGFVNLLTDAEVWQGTDGQTGVLDGNTTPTSTGNLPLPASADNGSVTICIEARVNDTNEKYFIDEFTLTGDGSTPPGNINTAITGMASATDNCSANVIITFADDFSTLTECSGTGTFVRTWTATDECGNTISDTQDIIIQDTTPPVAPAPPGDVTDQCATSIPAAEVLTAVDNCDGDITVSPTELLTPGACPHSFTIVRTWTFVDECDNMSSVTQNIIINDDTPPTMVCQNVTVMLDINGAASVTVTEIDNGSSDNCSTDPVLSIDISTFTCLDSTVPVTLSATDECGNVNTCIGNVTVVDDMPPIMECQNIEITIDPTLSNELIEITDIDNGSIDNCGIQSFSLSQTEFSCEDDGSTVVTLTGTDAAGNSSNCTAVVLVNVVCEASAGRF